MFYNYSTVPVNERVENIKKGIIHAYCTYDKGLNIKPSPMSFTKENLNVK